MRKIIVAALMAIAIGVSIPIYSAVVYPSFSGEWTLVDGSPLDDSWSPLGPQESIAQTANDLTLTAGNRTISYKIGGAGSQAQWIGSALLITVSSRGDGLAAIILITRTGPNEIKVLKSYPTIEPGGSMATVLLTYHRK
jgi:hypothetical protein